MPIGADRDSPTDRGNLAGPVHNPALTMTKSTHHSLLTMPHGMGRVGLWCLLVLIVSQLAACSFFHPSKGPHAGGDHHRRDAAARHSGLRIAASESAWQHFNLPGKTPTTFNFARHKGRHAIEASAASSASMLRHRVRVETGDLGKIHFSWNVPGLIDRADMAVRELDDSPVRVVLVFDGDRSGFSLKNTMLSELSLAMTGEPLPYATLMYVWCNTRPVDSVIVNPRTDRIRKIVAESGSHGLGRWLDYTRDVRGDFERAFGEPPGALLGVGIMTDSDNTRSNALAWYGGVELLAGKPD
jgi:hypothetical protein